jgi:hypothetical protein
VGESGGLSVSYKVTTRVLFQRDSVKGSSHERLLAGPFQVGSIDGDKKIRRQTGGPRLEDRRGKTVVLTNHTQPVPSLSGLVK